MRRLPRGPALGWGVAGAGGIVLFLGWFGVSGTALPSQQIPYLVSGGLGGLGLIVLGAAVLARTDLDRELGRLESRVEELLGLLTEPDLPAVPQAGTNPHLPEADVALVAAPNASTCHRADCPLVAGRSALRTLSPAQAGTLRRCRVCDPVVAA